MRIARRCSSSCHPVPSPAAGGGYPHPGLTDAIAASYDELPYRDSAFEFLRPNALARTAILAGLDAPPIERCRRRRRCRN